MTNFIIENTRCKRPDPEKIFDLSCSSDYEIWRQSKLNALPNSIEALKVEIEDPYSLKAEEITAIAQRCAVFGVAIYQLRDVSQQDKTLVHQLGRQLGLQSLDGNLRSDEDNVSSLQVRPQQGNQYIPYTNKPLSWHTDGYYNASDKQIRAIIMHCVRPAAEGGVNSLLDHEMLYIYLRDENPLWIEALMHPQAMTIPANIEEGKEIRDAVTGPVFSVDKMSGRLHMRYSARKRNIEWRDDVLTQQAVERINELLADESITLKYRLNAGEGIVCNNVLHNRTGFEDSATQKRLIFRARYYDHIE
ncbi:MAG: TauD/TfdA family dioxygenase [Gammaproteobacteria bacterium]|nr:TauD/TfdA family dioxygenase [Gammaproteobacteria bacterium]